MTTEEAAEGSDYVQSFARGLAVIRAFDAEHPELTLTDVAKRAGIPAAAARRFLRTLQMLGYVRTGGKHFALTPKVLELGFSYLSALSLPEAMQPHLELLSQQLGESVSAAVLSEGDIVYVARVPTRRIMTVGITIGTRFPAYATSMGRVLLSSLPAADSEAIVSSTPLAPITEHTLASASEISQELDRVRAQGWSLVDGELEIGLRSIAVPIHTRDGKVAAAVNVSTSTSSVTMNTLVEHHLPMLLDAARGIEADLSMLPS